MDKDWTGLDWGERESESERKKKSEGEREREGIEIDILSDDTSKETNSSIFDIRYGGRTYGIETDSLPGGR